MSAQPRASSINSRNLPAAANQKPCIVKHEFTSKRTALQAKVGDKGKIEQLSMNGDRAYVSFPGTANPPDWIPSSYLEVGMVRNFGSYTIASDIPAVIPSGVPPVTGQQQNIGLVTIGKLIDAFHNNQKDKLMFLPDALLQRLVNDERRADLKRKIQDSVTAQVKTILQNPDFKVSDIKALPVVDDDDHRAGVYILIIKDIIYVGGTKDFARRSGEHADDITATDITKNPRALAIRRHRTFTMHVLLTVNADDEELVRTVAEQTFICLFATYPAFLVLPVNTHPSDQTLAAALGQQTHVYMATVFTRIAQSCFLQTGWKGFAGRAESGAASGVNVESPLASHSYARTLWTKIAFQKQYVFRRGSATARTPTTSTSTDNVQILKISTQTLKRDIHFRTPTDPALGLQDGTPVEFVVEIMKAGPHPQAWSRLPEVGCWSDWEIARRVAVRVEWDFQGNTYTKYIFFRKESSYSVEDGTIKGDVAIYNQITALWRFFMQRKKVEYYSHEEIWQLGKADIREITVDHLTQEIRIAKSERSKDLGMSALRDSTLIAQELSQRGAANVGGPFGQFTNQQEEAGRTSCDFCKVSGKLRNQWGNKMCNKLSDRDQCSRCFMFGRPCSWTSQTQLGPGTPLANALGFRDWDHCDHTVKQINRSLFAMITADH